MALLSRRARQRRQRTVVAALAVLIAAEIGAQVLAPVIEPVPVEWLNATTERKHEQVQLLAGSAAEGTNIPVVFVGDSAAQQAFLPATFSSLDPTARLSYNAAIPGGVPGVVRPWLLDEVIPTLESEVVVWGVGITDVVSGYGDRAIDDYANARSTRDDLLGTIERQAAEVSALVRIRSALRDPSLLFGGRRDRVIADVESAEALLGPAGERVGYEAGPGEVGRGEAIEMLGSFSIDPNDLDDIADTIRRIRRRGKEVVLVEMPTSPAVVDILPNGSADVGAFRTALAEVADGSQTQVFRAVENFGDTAFVDHLHLTQAAADSLTAQVATALPALDLANSTAVFSAGTDLSRAIGQIGTDAVRAEFETLDTAIQAMEDACAEPEAWMEAATAVIDALSTTAAVVERASDDDFRSSALARQLASAIGGRVLLQSGCDGGRTLGERPLASDFHTRSSRLVATYERLDSRLSPPDNPTTSRLWMHPDQVFHLEGLRADAAAETPPEFLFVGSSEIRSGVDPTLFSDLTGQSAANIGINRATAEVAAFWIRDAIDIVRPETVVWGVSPADLIATCGLEAREAFYTAPANVRESLFENLPWRPTDSPIATILGPLDRATYEITETYRRAFSVFEPGSRGTLTTNIGVNDAAFASINQAYEPRIREGQDCGQRFVEMSNDVRFLVDNGVSVVIAGLPTHPDLLALHPSGSSGVLTSFDRSIEPLRSLGADYVDLTDVLDPEHFHSPIEYNVDGRRLVTEALAQELG